MAKKNKLKTPDWILEGFDSEEKYNKKIGKVKKKKDKTFKIRKCPKCESDEVGLILSNSNSEEGGGKEWECKKCKWKGSDINEKELTENELMAHLDKKGEECC